MKTVLDLVGEFAALNDAKVQFGGRLPPEDEKRWRELKEFYDLLMANTGLVSRPVSRRFSAVDVLQKVRARNRLRVPLETEMIFRVEDELHAGFAVNVSRRGVFLSSNVILPERSPLTVFLTSPDSVDEALLETEAEVAWVAERGVPEALLPPGMGIHLVGARGIIERYLDAMVVDALVRHLSGVDANALAPELVLSEHIEL